MAGKGSAYECAHILLFFIPLRVSQWLLGVSSGCFRDLSSAGPWTESYTTYFPRDTIDDLWKRNWLAFFGTRFVLLLELARVLLGHYILEYRVTGFLPHFTRVLQSDTVPDPLIPAPSGPVRNLHCNFPALVGQLPRTDCTCKSLILTSPRRNPAVLRSHRIASHRALGHRGRSTCRSVANFTLRWRGDEKSLEAALDRCESHLLD